MACTSPDQGGTTSTPSSSSTTAPGTTIVPVTTNPGEMDTGDLDDPEVRRISVGGEELVVAWADTPETRSRGLMQVRDLGQLDGMLFDLGSERQVAFTMRNTVIPLDIYFYDSEGVALGMLVMEPCTGEPCPSYSIDQSARFALEVPAGGRVAPGALDPG